VKVQCTFCGGAVEVTHYAGKVATVRHLNECSKWKALVKVASTMEEVLAATRPAPETRPS
jgi:hypothetical protein